MATTITTYSGWSNVGLGEYRLRMTLSRSSVNIANNTSTVRSRVWVEARNGGWFTNISSAHGQSIDGIQVYSGNINRTVANNSSALVLDNSRVITHSADGTRTVGSAASFSNYATGNMSVGATLVLDTIPRATTPSVSGSFTTGSSKTISLPYASSSFRHDLTFRIGGTVVHTINNAASSATWTPPHSLAERFTNSASTTLQLTTVTKTSASGSSIGSKVNNYTLTAGSSVVPTVSQVTWVDQNPLTANIGALVQGQSRVKGVVTASGIYNSTITNRSVTVAGTQYADTVPIELPNAGTITASGTATDSRGRTATRSANFNVLPYEVPQLGSGGFQVSRANSSWVPTDLGTNLIIDLDAFATSLEVGSTEKNQLSIAVHTRPASGGAWTARNVITGGLTYNGRIQVTGGSQFPVEQSYEVRITLSDNVADTPTELITTIPTATVALDLNGTQVGVGKYHERGALDVGGDAYASTLVSDSNVYGNSNVVLCPVGVIMEWAAETAPDGWLLCRGQAVSRSEYSELFDLIGTNYGSGNGSTTFNIPDKRGRVGVGLSSDSEFNALGKTFGAKTHTLTVSQMPSHSHNASPSGTLWRTSSTGTVAQGSYYGMASGYQVGNTGGGGAHNNIQPSITMNYIIRAR